MYPQKKNTAPHLSVPTTRLPFKEKCSTISQGQKITLPDIVPGNMKNGFEFVYVFIITFVILKRKIIQYHP